MQCATLQERVELDLLKSTRSPEAFLVPGSHVVGRLFAFFTCFGAFEDDYFAGHRIKR